MSAIQNLFFLQLLRRYYPILLFFTLSCIVPSDEDTAELSLYLADTTQRDTLSPYGKLKVAFSAPIDSSSEVNFLFNPPIYSYYSTQNIHRDTFTIVFTAPLNGSSHYSLSVTKLIKAINGGVLNPEKDSITFYTYPREKEPNSTAETADTLLSIRFGSIETGNDSDTYILTNPAKALYLNSYDSPTTLFLHDSKGHTIEAQEFKSIDTLFLADSLHFPLLITACAWQKSAGGYYKIGTIQR